MENEMIGVPLLANVAREKCLEGVDYLGRGEWTLALASLDDGLRLLPDDIELLANRGIVLRNLQRRQEALSCFEAAIAVAGGDVQLFVLCGSLLMEMGRNEAARVSYKRALTLRPDDFSIHWALAMASIPPILEGTGDISRSRLAFARALAGLRSQWERSGRPLAVDIVGSARPSYLSYQDENNRPLLTYYGRLCADILQTWERQQPVSLDRIPPLVPEGRIRVGIVSAHMQKHSVWDALTEGWLHNLSRSRFEVHLFHVAPGGDSVTTRARACADSYVGGERDFGQWVETIRARQLDVLIYPEIGMDPMTIRLAGLRLAPVQVTAWGHPETSGLPTVDYFLSADAFEPAGAQSHYIERLVRLPGMGVCYYPKRTTGAATLSERLGLDPRRPIAICPGAPFKYSPRQDRVLAGIARQVGDCQLVFFKGGIHKDYSNLLEGRLQRAFADAGADYARCCRVLEWPSVPVFHALIEECAVFLDTIGFSGFNTVMHAIECGAPIVAREGRFLRGRFGSGMLRLLGMPEFVASSDESFESLAVQLLRDRTLREAARQRICDARGKLFGDVAPVRALEDFLEDAVRRFHEGQISGRSIGDTHGA